jgi:hypothetical protein
MTVRLPRFRVLAFFLGCGILIGACSTTDPKTVPTNLTAGQLMKNAQVANSEDDYENAQVYFNLVKARFASDEAVCIEADYNLADILYKTGKFAPARIAFAALIDRYKKPGAERLPPFIPTLAERIIKQMDEIEIKNLPPSPAPVDQPTTASSR